MEVLVALLAFAGALLAVITTGVLVGRLRDEPSSWLVAWTITTVALTVSLSAIAIGHLAAFSGPTFRASQITGSLVAPLWLAVGVMQLLADNASARFAGWLLGVGITIVGVVIMLFDPIVESFTKAFPAADAHWDIWPEWLLRGVHGLVALMLLISLAIALLSWRDGEDRDIDNMNATLVLAPIGMGLAAAFEFTFPGLVIVGLLATATGGIWYAVAWPLAPYEDDEAEDDWEPQRTRRGREDELVSPARNAAGNPGGQVRVAEMSRPDPGPPRRSGLGDLVAEYRAGEQGEVDYAARMQPQDAFAAGPRDTYAAPPPDTFAPGPRDTYAAGPRDAYPPSPSDDFGGPATGHIMVTDGYGQPRRPEYGMPAAPVQPEPRGIPATSAVFPAPQAPPAAQAPPLPEDLAASLGVGFGGASRRAGGAPDPEPRRLSRPAPGLYGLLTVFTLLDGSGEAFDKLAEETVDAVQRNEPDTLLFVCHAITAAPAQRIVYELYRDEVAYAEHQRQPHMERFATERQPLVLATNVIGLTVNAAKVALLPMVSR